MLEAFVEGLSLVVQWPAIGFLLLGVLLGVWLGAVPGLGGFIGLVIILPFTFNMEPVSAFALLLALFAVTATGDTIASVMLGIPGTAASQATILDGYPLAKKGQAARAFGAAFTVSAIGGVFGGLVMAISLPVILPVILWFGSPEFFMLAVLGIAMVGSLSGSSIYKGIGAALIGLTFSLVGYAVIQPTPRFHFGSEYLLDGLPLLPAVLGLFAIPELMELAVKQTSISRIPKDQARGGGLSQGIGDAFRHWWLMVRCSIIGVYIGMIPGLGAAIVDWFAYGHTVQSAKDKSQFGQGDIRGVIGPEAANNAVRGGSLIPTVAFGIPGSASNAILLTALLIQGLRPGTEMLVDNLHITFSMVWTIILANVIAAILLMGTTNVLAKAAFLPGHMVVPGVMLFVFMGGWMASADMGDWVTLVVMGFVGTIMKRSGWPRPPVVLAFVLGPIMEQSFQLSMQGYGIAFLLRPPSLVIMVLIVITLFLAARGIIRSNVTGNAPTEGEGRESNPLVSLAFTGFWLLIFAAAAITVLTADWQRSVRQFPVLITLPAVVLFAWVFFQDSRALRNLRQATAGGWPEVMRSAGEQMQIGRVMAFVGWLAGAIVLAILVGQQVALPVYIAAYLMWWGRYSWKIALPYAAVGYLILYAFYGQLLEIFWFPSLLFG